MNIFYLYLVPLLTWEIGNVHSPSPTAGNLDFGRWPSNNLGLTSTVTFTPCEAITSKARSSSADTACNNECLNMKAEAAGIYNAFPGYKSTEYLQSKCGTVIGGKCQTVAQTATCRCRTRENFMDQLRSLSDCRGCIDLIRKFTTVLTTTTASDILAKGATIRGTSQGMEAVHMQKLPPSRSQSGRAPLSAPVPRRPRTPRKRRQNTSAMSSCCSLGKRPASSSDDEDDDGLPPQSGNSSSSPSSVSDELKEGKVLYTRVRVSGKVVQALVDTGADVSIIHSSIAGDIVSDGMEVASLGGQHSFQTLGRSTIKLSIGLGSNFFVSGFVADRKYHLILGNDFLVTYAAKIRISDGTMELSNGPTTVTATILFLPTAGASEVGMTNPQREGYTPLQLSAQLNGIDTRVIIDTGATDTVVNKNLVQQQIRPSRAEVSFGGSAAVGGMGITKVRLTIDGYSLFIQAIVPGFIPNFYMILGNDFNEQYVELIDYETKSVTLVFSESPERSQITVPALVIQGQ